MANIKSAIKRIRITEKQTKRNRHALSTMRTFCKKVLVAVEAGNKEEAQTALRQATSKIAKCVQRKIIHKNQGARRVRRLNAKVKALVTA
ncbi:30S ribosomal protein S20 [Magnetococcales bacterium HHB-1]